MHIDFSVRGEGEPLVLIHGLFGSRENLGAVARMFAEHYRVYSIDLPNHGRSGFIDHFTLNDLAEIVKTWMDEQALSSAFFFGHSLGGKVAMELAIQAPERVRKLVVADIAPVQYEERHQDIFDGLLSIDLDAIQSRRDADAQLSIKVQTPEIRSFLLKNLQKDDTGAFTWRFNLRALHRNYPSIIAANASRCSQVMVLFLKAQQSSYIVAEHRAPILARFPHADYKIIPNTGHWLHAEKPDLVAKHSLDFLAA